MRGKSDAEVFAYAAAHRLVLVTRDVDLADVRRFPSQAHEGIVVVRFPDQISRKVLVAAIVEALKTIVDEDLAHDLVIYRPGSLRRRRKP